MVCFTYCIQLLLQSAVYRCVGWTWSYYIRRNGKGLLSPTFHNLVDTAYYMPMQPSLCKSICMPLWAWDVRGIYDLDTSVSGWEYCIRTSTWFVPSPLSSSYFMFSLCPLALTKDSCLKVLDCMTHGSYVQGHSWKHHHGIVVFVKKNITWSPSQQWRHFLICNVFCLFVYFLLFLSLYFFSHFRVHCKVDFKCLFLTVHNTM